MSSFTEPIFTDEEHTELDMKVNETKTVMRRYIQELSKSDLAAATILTWIVKFSKGRLDKKYSDLDEALELLWKDPEVGDALVAAWATKSYRVVRELPILRAAKLMSRSEERRFYTQLSKSFEETYHGAAVSSFYEYLTQKEREFRSERTVEYYARYCSIVQSSGTGKSRMLVELSTKGVLVIYMNLGEEGPETTFPRPDPIPSQLLMTFPGDLGAYQDVCAAFFAALFNVIKRHLLGLAGSGDRQAKLMAWAKNMCDMTFPDPNSARSEFFKEVAEEYTQIQESNREDYFSWTAPVLKPYQSMVATLKEFFPGHESHPTLVIAIDEAHPLAKQQSGYRPVNVLCWVINAYSHYMDYPVWVVFASTSHVADFVPPDPIMYPSDRIAKRGRLLFPPYTDLGWDQSATAFGGVDIDNVSAVEHIASYGRPLWISLKNAAHNPRAVYNTAFEKLCGADKFDQKNRSHVLSVLGQRFALEVTFGHPDAVAHLKAGVASHLRICLGMGLDCKWRHTNYPAEPFLSCVAAGALHGEGHALQEDKKSNHLKETLDVLQTVINAGIVSMGERGELASRLLWLLGKDLFIRAPENKDLTEQEFPAEWAGHLADCQKIPVVDWLTFMFGEQLWEKNAQAREDFGDAYVNFSHWVCMESTIRGSKEEEEEEEEIELDEWTARHWQKTSAVQCSHHQPLVDKVIPIYFESKGGPKETCESGKSRMSQIYISDMARESDNKNTLGPIIRSHWSLGGSGANSLPYIAILVDLAWESSEFSATYDSDESDGTHSLRIYAPGMSEKTYPFLSTYWALMEALQNLVKIQQIPEVELPSVLDLQAQVEYGSTSSMKHMRWEENVK